MKKILLTLSLFLLLGQFCISQQTNTDVIPASSGLNLGHSNQRWNAFIQNLDVKGNCYLNGVLTPCFGGGSGSNLLSSVNVFTAGNTFNAGITTSLCTGCVYIDVSAFTSAGSTEDTWIAAALATVGANSSAILDATKIRGAQIWITDPFNAIIGQGDAPSKTGMLLLGCNTSITVRQSNPIPTGWDIKGCGNNFVSIQSTVLHADAANFPTTYNTGFITCNGSVGSGPPFVSTCSGTGGAAFTANQKNSLIMACLTTADGACSAASSLAGAPFFGTIQTVNSSTSLTILTPNGGTTAVSAVNYVIFGCIICMGDNSTNGPGNQNFGVKIHGFTMDANSVDGVVSLWNSDCANLCRAYDFLATVSNNFGVAWMGAQAQNSLFDDFWITPGGVGACTSTGAIAIDVRMAGASTTLKLGEGSIAVGGCGGTGALVASSFDMQGTVRGLHFVTGSGSSNVALAAGTNQACPKACPVTSGSIIGAHFEDINSSGSGAEVIHIGTNNSPSSYSIGPVKTTGSNSTYTNLIVDDTTGCSLTFSVEKVLNAYVVDASGVINQSTSKVLSCMALVGVVPDPRNTTSEIILATNRGGLVTFNNAGATTVSIADPNTTGFGSNYVVAVCNGGAGTVTITPTTTTFNVYNSPGAAFTANAANFTLTTGQCATIYSTNTKYLVRR